MLLLVAVGVVVGLLLAEVEVMLVAELGGAHPHLVCNRLHGGCSLLRNYPVILVLLVI